jgi:Protein of unknown function (DUF2695)
MLRSWLLSVAFMESASDDELIRSIAPDVMACLSRSRFFEKLDDLLSPKDDLPLHHTCDGTYKLSESILLSSGFDRADLGDIFRVFASMGGGCDCEVLYNVAEVSRLKAAYWRKRAEQGDAVKSEHTPPFHPNTT